MKISSTFKVVLESPDGNATFTFARAKLNDLLTFELEAAKRVQDGDKVETARANFQFIAGYLKAVEGLVHEDGTPVTVEEVRDLALPSDVLMAIVAGYNAALSRSADPEKKGLPSA